MWNAGFPCWLKGTESWGVEVLGIRAKSREEKGLGDRWEGVASCLGGRWDQKAEALDGFRSPESQLEPFRLSTGLSKTSLSFWETSAQLASLSSGPTPGSSCWAEGVGAAEHMGQFISLRRGSSRKHQACIPLPKS